MGILVNWIVSALVIFVAAYLLPGVHVPSFTTALVIAVVLGILNVFIKPILLLLTLPVTILTLGLFTLVINAFLIIIATYIVPDFSVDNFWWALLYAVVIAVINAVVQRFNSPGVV